MDNSSLQLGMMQTLNEADSTPEVLHELFAAFAAGLLVRRPKDPIRFMLLCLGAEVPRLATAQQRADSARADGRMSFGDGFERNLDRPPSRALALTLQNRNGKLDVTQFVYVTTQPA
jgi:hypothetical protein